MRRVKRKLFSSRGRYLIPKSLQTNVYDVDWRYKIYQPKLKTEADFVSRTLRLHGALEIDTGITGIQLKQEYHRLRNIILGMPEVANILKGVCLPVILTKRYSDDVGEDIDWQLEGVRKSYTEEFGREFGSRRFKNIVSSAGGGWRKPLAGDVDIIPKSGYQVIWDKRANEHVIALFFPAPFQGYPINVQREQMSFLAKYGKYGFILSGALEPMIMYPDELARGSRVRDFSLWQRWRDGMLIYGYTETLFQHLSALQWRSYPDCSFYFVVDSYFSLTFEITCELACPSGHSSGGLLFLG